MRALLSFSFNPTTYAVQRNYKDFKVADCFPTNITCICLKKTIPGLCMNGSHQVPRTQAKPNAFFVGTWNPPLTHLEAEAKQPLHALQVIVNEYCYVALRISVPMGDCN